MTQLQHAKYICPVVAQQYKIDKKTKGWPPISGPTVHPGRERLRQDIHTNLAATHHPPISQHEEQDYSTSGLCPDLRKAKNILTHIILSGTPPGAHPCDPKTIFPNRIVPPSHPPPPHLQVPLTPNSGR